MLRLYSFHGSSASFRVRIALALKGLDYEYASVGLRDGDQHSAEYVARNPQRLVPALDHDGTLLTQSLAILEYLEEVFPDPPLLPRDAVGRARVRSIAAFVACDIQPLPNLRVLRHLRDKGWRYKPDLEAWSQHWIAVGFDALEPTLEGSGRYCHGDAPTMADCYLVPQVLNARKVGMDVGRWPRIEAIDAACMELDPFRRARPENQPDYVELSHP